MEIQGDAARTTPQTAAITQLHGSSLRFVQGLHIMNGALDLRIAVGLANLIPVGTKRSLWGSDFGLGAAFRLHRLGRVDLQLYNAYRLLVMSSPDRDQNGIALRLEVGLGALYHLEGPFAVEARLGYSWQQLRYHRVTTDMVGGLETPTGVVFRTHMLVLTFTFLHFR